MEKVLFYSIIYIISYYLIKLQEDFVELEHFLKIHILSLIALSILNLENITVVNAVLLIK